MRERYLREWLRTRFFPPTTAQVLLLALFSTCLLTPWGGLYPRVVRNRLQMPWLDICSRSEE